MDRFKDKFSTSMGAMTMAVPTEFGEEPLPQQFLK